MNKNLFSAPVIEDDSENTSTSESEIKSNTYDVENDPEKNLSCCILMLDILLKQVLRRNAKFSIFVQKINYYYALLCFTYRLTILE